MALNWILRASSTNFATRALHTTRTVCAAPTRRRAKVDPALERAKEDRKKRRLEKVLRKMEKGDRIPKPLLELEVPVEIQREKEARTRTNTPLDEAESDRRALLTKEWNRFSGRRHRRELRVFDRLVMAQERALNELRLESKSLYLAAIEPDGDLLPYTTRGPTWTPPIEGHLQDGEYVDTTKKFEVHYVDMDEFVRSLARRRTKRKKMDEDEND